MKEQGAPPPPFLLALDLKGKAVLVVGNGEEARSRAQALLDVGALVSLISQKPEPELESWAHDRQLAIEIRAPDGEDLSGKWLAVLADRDPDLVSKLGPVALRERVPFCAVDQPEWNSFSHVALVRSASLQLGISSGGRAPAVVAALRRELGRLFAEADLASFVERMARIREMIDPSERSRRLRALAAEIHLVGTLNFPELADADGHAADDQLDPDSP